MKMQVVHRPYPQVDLDGVSNSELVALSDPVFAYSDVECSDNDDGLGCPKGRGRMGRGPLWIPT